MQESIINIQIIKKTNKQNQRHLSSALVVMVGSLFFCSGVSAVSFGDPAVRSYLGQSLNVQVPISGIPQDELNSGCVHATVQTIEGNHIATARMEFNYPKRAAHANQSDDVSTLVTLKTNEAIIEPAVTLSVALSCGALIHRSYSLLLDYAEHASPAVTMFAGNTTEEMASPPATSSAEPLVTRDIATKPQPAKRATMAKKAKTVTKSQNNISKKLPAKTPVPTDQLKISNAEIPAVANLSTSSVVEKKPVDIEQLRTQENSLAQERFASMLRDEPALLAEQAANTPPVNTADVVDVKAQEQTTKDQQKIQQLETELAQLKLLIQSNIKPAEKAAEHHLPTSLIVMNAAALLLLLVLLLVVGKLWLSLRKVRQNQNGSLWGEPAEKHVIGQKNEGKIEAEAGRARVEEKLSDSLSDSLSDFVPVSEQNVKRNEESGQKKPADHSPTFKEPFIQSGAKKAGGPEEASGTFNLFTNRSQSIQIEELSDFTQEAEFWVSINNPKRAIEIIEPQCLDEKLSMPVTLLYLLDLYRLVDEQEKYNNLSERLKHKYNISIPKVNETADQSKLKCLEDYEHVVSRCCAFWNTNYILPYLESLLIDSREGERIGFDLAVYRDILFLISICKELDRTKTVSDTMAS